MAVNANYDYLLSTTLDNYRKKLTDNVFEKLVLLWFFKEKNRARMLSGGLKIVEPILHEEGEAFTAGEWDEITITPQEGTSAAEFPWRQLYATILISGLEEAMNSGEEAIVNLLETKIMQAENTIKNKLNAMLVGDGTGNSGKDWLGLAALIGTGTVGNINPATAGNEFWKSPVKDMEDVDTDTLIKELTTLYNTSADGNDTVDGLLASQDAFELYESLLTPNVRYEDVKAANAGFTSLRFKQSPMYLEKALPEGTIYGVNSKYISLVGHKQRWFKQTKLSDGLSSDGDGTKGGASAHMLDARFAVISAYGNMTVRNRKRHFKMFNIGAVSGP
jgi:hypothetical protein